MSALILISVLGVLMLYLGIFGKKGILAPVGIIGLLALIALFYTGWHINHAFLGDMLEFDRFSIGFNIGMVVITLLIFLFGPDYYERMERHVAEHYALILFSLTGGFLLTSYTNLLMLFLGIEILSIPLYVMAGGKKHSLRSNEASLKYFLIGSFATAFLLMGITLLYGATGSFDTHVLADRIGELGGSNMVLNFGMFFVVAGLAFKVGAVPFHFWVPDVYQGAPTLVTIFMATVVKMAAFAGFYRFIEATGLPAPLARAMVLLTLLTLLVGYVTALGQTNFKRLMAYSSVSHAGFLLLILLSVSGLGTEGTLDPGSSLLYYTFTYSLATAGMFVLFIFAKRAYAGLEDNSIFQGMFAAKPWLGIMALILLLSLAGIPLTAGFVAKYQAFLLGVGSGWVKTVLFGVLMALLGVYYYIMIAKEVFTRPRQAVTLTVAPLSLFVVVLCTVGVLVLAVRPEWAML